MDWTVDTLDALTAGDGHHAFARTVLVVVDGLEGVERQGEELIDQGYRVQVALAVRGEDGGTLRGMPNAAPDAVLVALSTLSQEAGSLVAAVKAHIQSPLVPIIGVLPATSAEPGAAFDSTLYRPAHPRQVAGRVDAMIRLQSMQHEALRRAQVLRLDGASDADTRLDFAASDRGLRILFVGQATPDFNVILNALRDRNAEVVAAFTSFTAFDYLHSRPFDAIVVDAVQAAEPARSLLEAMGRNVRLHHVPRIVLVGAEAKSPCPAPLLDAATDVISSSDPVEEITNRVLEPANFHLVHSALRADLEGLGGEAVREPDSRLYTRRFLESYLDFLASEGERRSICTLRLVPNADFAVSEPLLRVAMAQAGELIAGLVRVNDLVARVGFDTFAVAMEPLHSAALEGVARRLVEVVEAAAFESGRKDDGPFTLVAETGFEVGDRPEMPAATRVSRLLAA